MAPTANMYAAVFPVADGAYENRHTGYSCPRERSHQFWFLYTFFVFELGAHTGQMYGQTGKTCNAAYKDGCINVY